MSRRFGIVVIKHKFKKFGSIKKRRQSIFLANKPKSRKHIFRKFGLPFFLLKQFKNKNLTPIIRGNGTNRV